MRPDPCDTIRYILLSGLLLLYSCCHAQFALSGDPRAYHAPARARLISGAPTVLAGQRIYVTFATDSSARGREHLVGAAYRQLFIDKFAASAVAQYITILPDSAGARYQLVITTTRLEPGMDDGLTHIPARLSARCDFRDARGRSVALLEAENVPGEVFGPQDQDTSLRMAHCYEKLAKMLCSKLAPHFVDAYPSATTSDP